MHTMDPSASRPRAARTQSSCHHDSMTIEMSYMDPSASRLGRPEAAQSLSTTSDDHGELMLSYRWIPRRHASGGQKQRSPRATTIDDHGEMMMSYDGSRGVTLGRPEAAHIAIARALVRSGDILLLDEATHLGARRGLRGARAKNLCVQDNQSVGTVLSSSCLS
jgi:hypothetical protein